MAEVEPQSRTSTTFSAEKTKRGDNSTKADTKLEEFAVLLKNIAEKEWQIPLTPPVKTTQYPVDAHELFGEPPYNKVNGVNLRTSDQMKQGEDMKLPQFDPNFFSPQHIQCRYPHCPKAKARSAANHDSSQLNKEDLYLCPNHRQEMTNLITRQCAEKGITVNYKDFKSDDFDDYTFLIGWMEKAFQQFEKKASQSFLPSRMDLLLAEIFLNVRNFLMITNILLNPDDENRHSVLTPIFDIVRSVLERCNNNEYVRNVVHLLRGIMQILLLPFGVVYDCVCLPLVGNPGAQIGAGIGGLLGSTGAAVRFGGTSRLIALGAGIGLLCGGLLGGGIFNLREHNQNRHHMHCNFRYRFTGATDGCLSMHIEEVGWEVGVEEVE